VLMPKILALALSAALHFVSPMPAMNLLASGGGVSQAEDLAYADGPRHRLDVYAPKTALSAPVVVFFYGGGWESGSKEMYRFVGHTLAARGIVAMIPDYRVYPEVRFPTFMEDAAQAVAWVRSNAARFGGDPDRIFLVGHSAGANIAALLATDATYLRAVGLSPARDMCGVIGMAGAYDFVPPNPQRFAAIFGPEAAWPRSMPINFAVAGTPPMLLLTGEADGTVEPGNTTRMAMRLDAAGGRAQVEVYPGVSHRSIIVSLGFPLTVLTPALDDIMRFIGSGGRCAQKLALEH
jgi:acetyl esterase/lipase